MTAATHINAGALGLAQTRQPEPTPAQTPRIMPGRAAGAEFDVPFHDVDLGQVVWHGHYYKYFELARTELMRACQLDVAEIIALDYRLVVIESRCRHRFPLRYGERVRVDACFRDLDHRLQIGFEIYNVSAGRRAASGHTTLAVLDAHGNLLLDIPKPFLERIHAWTEPR